MASCVNVISGGPGHFGVGYPSGLVSHSHTDQLSACRLTPRRTQVLCRSFNVAKPQAPFMLPKTSGCPRALPGGEGERESDVGLCFGRKASVRPSADEVIKIYKDYNISKMWISPTDEGVQELLNKISEDKKMSSQMQIVLCIDYKELGPLATSGAAKKWVDDYIIGHERIISHICVGDVIGKYDNFSLPDFNKAMNYIKALVPASINFSAIVNTVSILGDSYHAQTRPSDCKVMDWYVQLLTSLQDLNGSPIPIFVRIMPYFLLTEGIPLVNYLLYDGTEPYMIDEKYWYRQVFDAMIDSIFCAVNDAGFSKMEMYVVSGWPTKGPKPEASSAKANIYNHNLLKHVGKSTPRENKPAEILVYSLVNEDKLETTVNEFKYLGTFLPWQNVSFPYRPKY